MSDICFIQSVSLRLQPVRTRKISLFQSELMKLFQVCWVWCGLVQGLRQQPEEQDSTSHRSAGCATMWGNGPTSQSAAFCSHFGVWLHADQGPQNAWNDDWPPFTATHSSVTSLNTSSQQSSWHWMLSRVALMKPSKKWVEIWSWQQMEGVIVLATLWSLGHSLLLNRESTRSWT